MKTKEFCERLLNQKENCLEISLSFRIILRLMIAQLPAKDQNSYDWQCILV